MTAILLILLLAGIYLLVRWLNQYLDRFALSPESRVLVMVSAISAVLLIAVPLLLRPGDSSSASSSPDAGSSPAQAEQNLDDFEKNAYPDLSGLRQQMIKQGQQLNEFFRILPEWVREMPNQHPFLQRIIDIRWEQRLQLQQAYADIDRSRREFWLHYHAGSDQHVREMFDKEAIRLQQRIQDALGKSLKATHTEGDVIADYLTETGDLLESKAGSKNQGKGKRQATVPAVQLPPPFKPYGEANQQRLLEWLSVRQENGLLQQIRELQQEEQKIRGKISYILEFQQVNTDLSEPVRELVESWNNALIHNQYAQYRLLFATEVMELALRLGVAIDDRYLVRLHSRLQELAPQVVKTAIAERHNAEYSYQPEADHKYRKPSP